MFLDVLPERVQKFCSDQHVKAKLHIRNNCSNIPSQKTLGFSEKRLTIYCEAGKMYGLLEHSLNQTEADSMFL